MGSFKYCGILLFSFFIWISCKPNYLGYNQETFDESLLIQPLRYGHVSFTFNFTLTRSIPSLASYLSLNSSKAQHFMLFPRSLAHILQSSRVHTFDLSLTQGRWLPEVWGTTPWTPWHEHTPPGMELKAWLLPHSSYPSDLNYQWKNFTHALAGLFCASIHTGREASLISHPKHTFADRFHSHGSSSSSSLRTQFFHASLVRESVCTENLTPWVKLLPGHTQTGLSAILDAYRLFNANFHSIQTHVDLECDLNQQCRQIVKFMLATVFDVSRVLDLPHSGPGYASWSLSKLLEKSISGKCSLAKLSQVRLALPPVPYSLSLKLDPNSKITKNGWQLFVYDLKENVPFDFELHFSSESVAQLPPLQPMFPFSSYRFISGTFLGPGVLHLHLHNLANQSQSILYYDTFPWYLPRFLHTLKCECQSTPSSQFQLSPTYLLFQHALDRIQPSVMEIVYTLPPLTHCLVSIDFERLMLHFSEYPPDSSRGYPISAGIITFLSNETEVSSNSTLTSSNGLEHPRMYLNPLQTQLPAPDFSMPYNVITFTSTAVVIFFSAIFGLTTRNLYRFTINEKGEPLIEDNLDMKKEE